MKPPRFDEVLEAVDHLPVEDQAELVEVVLRRLAEKGRQRIAADAKAALEEYKSGKAPVKSVDQIMREIEE